MYVRDASETLTRISRRQLTVIGTAGLLTVSSQERRDAGREVHSRTGRTASGRQAGWRVERQDRPERIRCSGCPLCALRRLAMARALRMRLSRTQAQGRNHHA